MKVGLFFGSFNPVHNGHMIVASIMAEDTDLDEVWMIVSPLSPFKKNSNLATEQDRLNMVHLAIGDHAGIKCSDIEFYLPRPSYTINTLSYLAQKHPQKEFVLIMGEDNLPNFHKWKRFEDILDNYPIYVYKRTIKDSHPYSTDRRVKIFDVPLLNISATMIRIRLLKGSSVQYMVPDTVLRFLEENQIYQVNKNE